MPQIRDFPTGQHLPGEWASRKGLRALRGHLLPSEQPCAVLPAGVPFLCYLFLCVDLPCVRPLLSLEMPAVLVLPQCRSQGLLSPAWDVRRAGVSSRVCCAGLYASWIFCRISILPEPHSQIEAQPRLWACPRCCLCLLSFF